MSDAPQSESQSEPKGIFDQVIDQLDKRIVPPTTRHKLRSALNRADTPLGGKPASDEAVGRIARGD